MTTTALTIPAFARNALMVNGNKTALTEAASGGVGGKAEFPKISIEAGRWRLIDVEGEEQVLKTFEINFAVVSINPSVSKAWYKDKFVPGGERGAPQCYSDNGQVAYPEAEFIQSQQCATCDKNVWGSDINPQNGNKLKACKDTKHISVMFLNPENLEADVPEIYSQRLSAMSMINFSNFAKEVAAAGGALDYIVVKAEFDDKASYPLVKYSVLRNMTEDEWNVVSRVREDARAIRATGADQKVIPIMAERVQHLALNAPAADTGEIDANQLAAARAKEKAEAERMERVRQAQEDGKKLALANAKADREREAARAAELAANAPPAESAKDRKMRELREQMAALEAAEANDPSVGADPDAKNVTKITDVEPKTRQRHPVNVVKPESATPDMEDLLAAAMK